MPAISVVSERSEDVTPTDEAFIAPRAKAGIHILIIEADRPLRTGCASVLAAEGYDVTVESRGDSALELLRRRAYDIILLDLATRPIPATQLLLTALQQHPRTISIAMGDRPSVRSSVEIL